MGLDMKFVEYAAGQMEKAGVITYKKMFGGVTVYCNGKVVGLICDDQLFVKPTEGGRSFIGDPVELPAYPGAKPSFFIEDQLDDSEWITELIMITERELPPPKPKKKK